MRPRVPQPRLLCSRCLQRAQSSRSPHSLGRVDAAAATPLSRTAAPFSARQYHGIPPHPRSLWATPRLAASVIHKRRSSAASDAAHLDRLARSSPHYRSTGIARLEHRSLFYISGPDAAKFLQGLITNNVDPGNFDCGFYTGILNAKGRVQTDAIVYPRRGGRDEWRAFLEVDAAEARNIEVHLKRHKLKSKVKIERVDGKMSVWALWGVGEDRLSEAGFPRKIFDHVPDGTNRADRQMMLDPRASGFGFRVLAADKAMEEATQKDGSEPRIQFNSPWPLSEEHLFASVPVVALKSYHIHRYAHGIPEGSSEIIPGSALPLESNMDYMYGIDFKKGCYVGQELTIRTKHTGVVRKRILPVHLSVSGSGSASHDLVGESIPTQTIIKRISKDSPSLPEEATRNSTPTFTLTGREAGKFLGGIGNIGLALCRLDPMTKGDEEFGMEWPMGTASEHGQPSEVSQQQSQMARVKVRALVPDWHETRREELERKPRAKGTELEDES